jgi:hypothetical protein
MAAGSTISSSYKSSSEDETMINDYLHSVVLVIRNNARRVRLLGVNDWAERRTPERNLAQQQN